MVTIAIKKINPLAQVPTRGSDFAAGYDLYSTEEYTLKPLERKLFKTGITIALPKGTYGRIAPRSGLAYKDGIDVLAGVIDEDYRGDVGVILINLGSVDKKIIVGDKIAQLIVENYNVARFKETEELTNTDRGVKGYGSSDVIPDATPESTVEGTLKAFKTILESFPQGSLSQIYQKTGGVEVKKRYSDEIKEREA